ncbi:PTS transporter subunit EIIC [Breznakia pachnodae]|uniref:PTS system lactose-specific EIICB component n=1 Tax=Breznakia pachnodae TaxID=265178 RepID=A0ABU0E8M8_9FIRM|nr:PTS transporter subunit EIIC [Breznakia pachnodae]MDQ0363079.1 PTS system cellobiose-specific IIC component [Breznakia pachnodae]
MKILLVCGAGASSGFMAQSMRKAAKKRGLEVEIIARSDAEMLENISDASILLVGPHLAYNKEGIERDISRFGIPVMFIDKEIYGSLDGEAALESALQKMDEYGSTDKKKVTTNAKDNKKVIEEKQDNKKGFFNWVNNSLAPKLNNICKNHYIASIQESIMSVLPMIMVGSISSIVGVMRNFWDWVPDVSLLNTFSFGLIAIFIAFLIPLKVLEKKSYQKLKLSASVTSVAVFFLIVMPEFNDGTISFVQDKIGTGGMIVSVFVGIFVSFIFSFASKHSLFKEETSMPDIVVTWVDAMLPAIVCLTLGILCYNYQFDIYAIIRSAFEPIASIGQTLPGFVLISFLTCFLYSFGFTWILFPIVWAIWMDGIAANAAAVAIGEAATNITLMESFHGIMYIGGQGATLTLVILMIFSKSKRLSAIGKVTIVPSIFNINEPVVFGAPVVWNPLLMIPLWLNSIVLPLITYFVFMIGLVPIPHQPFQLWYLPIYIQSYFATGSVAGVILCLFLTAVSFMIWLPFFKSYEKEEVLKEKQAEIEQKYS